jgi:uncharacterized caspase-like protein
MSETLTLPAAPAPAPVADPAVLEPGRADDWAVVVGIDGYPMLKSLQGAEHDARAFHAWLTDPAGGNIQHSRVKSIVSSGYPAPADVLDSKPIADDVYRAYKGIVQRAKSRPDKSRPFARRLYLYFAGHGFAPPSWEEACLFMANASLEALGEHIPGMELATYFVRSGHFEEVALFMDCCRERMLSAPFHPIPLTVPGAAPGNRTREFYALAAPWGQLAREKPFPPEPVQGVFTKAVLEGLRGKAATPQGTVTGTSLSSYVFQAMKRMLGKDYADPRLRANSLDDITFVTGIPLAQGLTRLTVSFTSAGDAPVNLRDGTLTVLSSHRPADGPWMLDLPRGIYGLVSTADGRKEEFVVEGDTIDVEF